MSKMMIDEATVKLALEALEEAKIIGGQRKADNAITDLREALASEAKEQTAQQQEPFTYYRHYDNGLQDWPDEKTIPLYTTPQPPTA